MKLFHALLLTLPLLGHSYPSSNTAKSSSSSSEDKVISLDEVELQDNDHAASGSDSQIQKRSGSFDYVAHLKSGLLSSIGQASASIASGSSGGSSGGGGDSYKSYGAHGNSVDYNPWSFKKSVLNTIFQAVKAITGGVTALKGQLIKGSGYALSASGNIVAASGDKVTDVGKSIINSAQINSHSYSSGASVHPFAKFSSLSAASSGSSSGSGDGNKHPVAPVVHTETITTYEIPPGHGSYGPPSKPPTYSSATHQYLPPGGGGYAGGGAPFSSAHAAFEAPASNYLATGYDAHDDFNIYGRHQKLSEAETRKAAAQLQEILSLLPTGKTEFTASKTVVLDTHDQSPSFSSYTAPGNDLTNENVDLRTYGLPNDLGLLESLSHTESITAAYRQRPGADNPSDIYRQMAKKQTAEEVYLQKHPNEAYDYRPTSPTGGTDNQDGEGYKYNNYHAANSALQDLNPIIAALEVAKRQTSARNGGGGGGVGVSKHYTVEKSVYKPTQTSAKSNNNQFKYLQSQPTVQKTKHIYFDPAQNKVDKMQAYRPAYVHATPSTAAPSIVGPTHTYAAAGPAAYKVRRQVPSSDAVTAIKVHSKTGPRFKYSDYEISDPIMFNRDLMSGVY